MTELTLTNRDLDALFVVNPDTGEQLGAFYALTSVKLNMDATMHVGDIRSALEAPYERFREELNKLVREYSESGNISSKHPRWDEFLPEYEELLKVERKVNIIAPLKLDELWYRMKGSAERLKIDIEEQHFKLLRKVGIIQVEEPAKPQLVTESA